MADETLARLIVYLGGDTRGLDEALKNSNAGILKFTKGVSNVTGELFNLRNALAVVAGVAVADFVKKGAAAGDEIAKTALKIGITTNRLQEYRYAAESSGTKSEDLDAALLQLNKRLGEVNGGVTEAAIVLGKLGLGMTEIKGKSTDEVFRIIADRLGSVKDKMEQARISTDLFGKAGQQLLPLLVTGSAGLSAMAEEAHRLGLVLSAETIKKAEEANDEFVKIGSALKVAGVNIAVGFLPALEDIRKTVTAPDFQEGVKSLASGFASLVSWLVDHKAEIAEAAAAWAGFRVGAAAGAAFGPQAAALLGLAGATVGFAVAAREAAPEIDKLNRTITATTELRQALTHQRDKTTNDDQIQSLTLQIDALDKKLADAKSRKDALLTAPQGPNQATGDKPQITVSKDIEVNYPQVDQAITELSLKTRILRNDFANLAPGFVETGTALKVWGNTLLEGGMNASKLSPQLADLNLQLLAFKGAQLTQEVLPVWQQYEQQIARIQQLFDAGVISAETYQRAMRNAALNSGTSWDTAGASIAGSFATIAGSFGKSSGAMATAAKAFAIVQATLSTYTGMAKALELPFPANIAAVAAVAAQGFAFVANLKTQAVPKFATGGSFRAPGAGGLDTSRMMMDLNPGERVDITPSRYGEDAGGGVSTVPIVLRGRSFAREDVADLIEQINVMTKDGYRLEVAPA